MRTRASGRGSSSTSPWSSPYAKARWWFRRAAVQKSQQGSFVYVIKPDLTVAVQPVTVGMETDGDVVVERGVQAGDRVVTDGQLRLVPGAKVDIKAGAAPAEATGS